VAELVPRLNKLRDRIAGGEDMAALAKAWSEDPSALEGGDLGARAVAQLSAEVAAAISELQPGQLSQVVTTANDVRLVRVEERVAPKVDEIAEVQDAIADKLMRAEKLPRMAQAFAEDELLPKWKETGTVPDDLLAAHSLTAATSGKLDLGGAQRNPFGPPQVVIDAARNADVGAVLPEVYETGGTLYVAKLIAREEPDPAKFEAEKEEIRAQFLLARRQTFYDDWMSDQKAQATIE
jgi:peptidyl-prolyl cis-trans isomerase D